MLLMPPFCDPNKASSLVTNQTRGSEFNTPISMLRISNTLSIVTTKRLVRVPNTLSATSALNQNPRSVHSTAPTNSAAAKKTPTDHTIDTYSKDVDGTPVSDSSVYRIDSSSDTVQKPHEPPSGEWSRAGVQFEEYRHVEGEKEPYAPSGGNKGRYGSRMGWAEDKGAETSKADEGPDGKSSHGRK